MYTAVPKGRRCGPGVLVLHSWWGMNEFFRSFCDRLAAVGFVALAPDLFGGKVATTEAEARALRAQASASRREPAYRYLIRMIGELSDQEAVSRGGIAVIGFSMGGHWAYWLAQRPELPIVATVTFYAARNGAYTASNSRFLAHFAEDDPWVSNARKT
jgi:carboxymethylenebutenolidase